MASLLDTSWQPIWHNPWGYDYGLGYGGFSARAVVNDAEAAKPAEPAPAGEKTGQQNPGMAGSAWPLGFGMPLRASYSVYRQLLRIPSVALVRTEVFGSILSGSWTVETDDDIPDTAKVLIESTFLPKRTQILRHALRALDFGHSKFEVVRGAMGGDIVPVRFKPLSWQQTQISVLESTGTVVGLEQNGVKLRGPDYFLYTHDGEPGEPEGRSRLENVREAGSKWLEVQIKIGRLIDKEAGSIIVGTYPPGSGRDEAGAASPNRTLMSGVAERASQGAAWLAVENAMGALTPSQRNTATVDQIIALLGMKLWGIEKVDLAGNGVALAAMQAYAAYLDVQMIRGYCRPERSVIEGVHGTKAEAGTHSDTGTTDSETTEADIVEALNCGPVDDTLEANYGPKLRGKVRIVAQPLRDVQEAIDTLIITNLTTGQMAGDIYRMFDVDAVFDRRGIQKREKPLPAPEPVQPPPPGKPANGSANSNGNGMNGKRKSMAAMSRIYERQERMAEQLFADHPRAGTVEMGGRFKEQEANSNIAVMEELGEVKTALRDIAAREIHVEVNNPPPAPVEPVAPPQVTVTPQINVPEAKPRVKKIKRDSQGRISEIHEG